MAAINVTLVGLGNGEPFTFVGLASLTGLGVGGGPILPPEGPGTWPPQRPPHPSHPIVTPPPGAGEKPPVPPPSIWPPGPGIDFPSHPIVIPPPVDPDKPPVIPPGSLITWTPVWTPDDGWQVIGIPNVPHPSPS